MAVRWCVLKHRCNVRSSVAGKTASDWSHCEDQRWMRGREREKALDVDLYGRQWQRPQAGILRRDRVAIALKAFGLAVNRSSVTLGKKRRAFAVCAALIRAKHENGNSPDHGANQESADFPHGSHR